MKWLLGDMCSIFPNYFVKVVFLRVVNADRLSYALSVKPASFAPLQGYITPMDYTWLKHLIPDALQNNKDVLFGNIRELYEFHDRYPIIHIIGGCGGGGKEEKAGNQTDGIWPQKYLVSDSHKQSRIGELGGNEGTSTTRFRGKREKTFMKPERGIRHPCHIYACALLPMYLCMPQHPVSTC